MRLLETYTCPFTLKGRKEVSGSCRTGARRQLSPGPDSDSSPWPGPSLWWPSTHSLVNQYLGVTAFGRQCQPIVPLIPLTICKVIRIYLKLEYKQIEAPGTFHLLVTSWWISSFPFLEAPLPLGSLRCPIKMRGLDPLQPFCCQETSQTRDDAD